MLRYTVLRLLIFFGCLIFFWLVGLRNNEILLLAASAGRRSRRRPPRPLTPRFPASRLTLL